MDSTKAVGRLPAVGRVSRGCSQRVLADIVSLVRYAVGHDNELAPAVAGGHQGYIAGSVSMEPADLKYAPFAQLGGIGRGPYPRRRRVLLLEEMNLAWAGNGIPGRIICKYG